MKLKLKENGTPKFLKKISKIYNINYKTSRNKYSKWEDECLQLNVEDNRGNETIFSKEEEEGSISFLGDRVSRFIWIY